MTMTMTMTMAMAAGLSLAIWIYLVGFHGRFWHADQRLEATPAVRADWPDVVAVIPARNEAETIGAVLKSHLASEYPGKLSIILVDDHSDDATAEIAARLAGDNRRDLIITQAPPLAAGWTGKLWALRHGLSIAAQLRPGAGLVLLSDADIIHGPDTLARLVSKMQDQGLSLTSLMAKLDARGLWGALLMPAFVFFFQKLYPFPKINDPDDGTAGAAGGCVLVRREALDEAGGIDAIHDALIDDCTLARLIQGSPPRRKIWLGLADDVESLRDNRQLGSIWHMVARTAYTQLRHSPLLLLGTVAGILLVYLAGPLAVLSWPVHGSALAAFLGLAAWLAMSMAYGPTLRYYGKPMWLAALLPVSAAFYLAMTIDSAHRHWRGRGGVWKGRSYPAPGS